VRGFCALADPRVHDVPEGNCVPGMMYRLESWCEDTRGKLNTARRSGRKSNINKAMATPVMACQEEA
jgi:hypothetical protein